MRLLIAVFFLALALRIAVLVLLSSHQLLADERQYHDLAVSITQGNGFTLSDGKPTAFRAPFYPSFVALVYSVFGFSTVAVQLVQSFLLSLTCLLIFFLGQSIFDRKVGCWAAVLAAVYPLLIYPAYQINSEALFVFLFTLSLFVVFKAREKCWYSLLAGFLLALSSLTKPMAIFAVPFFLIWIYKRSNKSLGIKSACLTLIILIICLTPWTIRNYHKFNAFVPFTTCGGIAYYNSYVLPPEGLGFNSLETIPAEYFSITNEAAQSHYLIQYTNKYIIHNWVKVVRLTMFKVFLFFYPFDGYWYPFSLGSKYNIFWSMVFIFSLIGLRFTGLATPGHRLLLMTIIAFLMCVLVFHGSPRYRLALEPVYILLAVFGYLKLRLRSSAWVYSILGSNFAVWLIFRYLDMITTLKWRSLARFF